jgi:hypothetical protein
MSLYDKARKQKQKELEALKTKKEISKLYKIEQKTKAQEHMTLFKEVSPSVVSLLKEVGEGRWGSLFGLFPKYRVKSNITLFNMQSVSSYGSYSAWIVFHVSSSIEMEYYFVELIYAPSPYFIAYSSNSKSKTDDISIEKLEIILGKTVSNEPKYYLGKSRPSEGKYLPATAYNEVNNLLTQVSYKSNTFIKNVLS